MDRFPSLLLSLILHLAVFALVLFWPDSMPEKPKLSGLVVRGYVTLGKESLPSEEPSKESFVGPPLLEQKGKDDVIGPPLPQQNTTEPEQTVLSQNDDIAKQPDTPFVDPLKQDEPKTEKAPVEQAPVEPVPELAPIEQPKKEDLSVPQPKIEETPKKPEQETIDVSRKEAKKEAREPKPAQSNATQQKKLPSTNATLPTSPVEPKAVKKQATTNATKEAIRKKDQEPLQKPQKSEEITPKKEALEDVLNDIKKSTVKAKQEKAPPKNELSDVLHSLKEENKKSTTAQSTVGTGGTGIGAVTQAYAEVVGEAIKQNWVMASRADQQELFATVRIYLAKDGTIEKYEVLKPAGERLFDSSLINAIASTNSIPEPPPTQRERVIDVNFYP